MTRSIRLRLTLFALALVAICQTALVVLVLERLSRVLRDDVDEVLGEELVELAEVQGSGALEGRIQLADRRRSKWDETFIEVRDAARVLAATANVPIGGLAPEQPAGTLERPITFERVNPASRRGHRRIRIARAEHDGRIFTVARSIKRQQRTWWRIREQLAWGLAVLSLLAALLTWWMASRALAPVRQMTERAEQLGTSLAGEIPRSGRGDELDSLAEVLNALLERIREQLRRMRRMTADAAHALRTPLTIARGNLELQLDGMDTRSSAETGAALEALDELGALIGRLLLLERVESQPLDSERNTRIRLDQLVHDLVDTLRPVADEREIALLVAAEPVEVRGDESQLRVAISNLIDNALRHTPASGQVQVDVAPRGDRARLEVRDSGPGIPADRLERVFERFFSDPGPGAGTGLGLPIARAIARSHRGTLRAVAASGAHFVLELPALPPEAGSEAGSTGA